MSCSSFSARRLSSASSWMFSKVRALPLRRSSRRNESDVAPAHRTMMLPAVSSKVCASDSFPRASTRRKKQSKSSPSACRARSHWARLELRGCSFFRYFSVMATRDVRLLGFGFGVNTCVSAPHSGATRLRSSVSNSCLYIACWPLMWSCCRLEP